MLCLIELLSTSLALVTVLLSVLTVQLSTGIYLRPPEPIQPTVQSSRDARSREIKILSGKSDGKSNSVVEEANSNNKRSLSPFSTDQEVSRYLKVYGLDLMLWRCSNAIQPYWIKKPIPYIDLYCEVIGTIRSVSWKHNDQNIEIQKGDRYQQIILPHFEGGRYFSRWIEFRLRIHNATRKDSGMYTFSVTSPSGHTDQQTIYVDIAGRRKRRKNKTLGSISDESQINNTFKKR